MNPKRISLIVLSFLLLGALACNLTRQDAQPLTATPENRPSIALMRPTDGATVESGQTVTIEAAASDTGGGVTRVEFRLDGAPLVSLTPPDGPKIYWTARHTWTPTQPGAYSLQAVAYRGGLAGRADQITLTVQGEAAPGGCVTTIAADLGLYVRSGPATEYESLGALSKGTTAALIGRVGDNSWWQVRVGELTGWVAAEYTDPRGDCRNVPVTWP